MNLFAPFDVDKMSQKLFVAEWCCKKAWLCCYCLTYVLCPVAHTSHSSWRIIMWLWGTSWICSGWYKSWVAKSASSGAEGQLCRGWIKIWEQRQQSSEVLRKTSDLFINWKARAVPESPPYLWKQSNWKMEYNLWLLVLLISMTTASLMAQRREEFAEAVVRSRRNSEPLLICC